MSYHSKLAWLITLSAAFNVLFTYMLLQATESELSTPYPSQVKVDFFIMSFLVVFLSFRILAKVVKNMKKAKELETDIPDNLLWLGVVSFFSVLVSFINVFVAVRLFFKV